MASEAERGLSGSRAEPENEDLGQLSVGDRLRKVRGDRNQTDFATQLGFHFNTVGRYERGDRPPDFDYIVSLCEKEGG